MKKTYCQNLKYFITNKYYLVFIILSCAFSYLYLLTHETIGMDDTAVHLYYDTGLAAYMGRWVIFILNTLLFHILTTIPVWLSDLFGIIILAVSTFFWNSLWKTVSKDSSKNLIPYLFFGILLITNPLLSELQTFTMACLIIGMGYLFVSISLFFFFITLEKDISFRKRLINISISIIFEILAIGCLESTAILFIIAAVCAYALLLYTNNSSVNTNPLWWLLLGIILFIVTIAGRSVITKINFLVFNLDSLDKYNMGYYTLFGNLLSDIEELKMMIKRFFVVYYVNAVCFLPIAVLLLSYLLLFVLFISKAITNKKPMLLLCAIALPVLPLLMSIAEGLTTRYRSAQYIPFLCAYASYLLLYTLQSKKKLLLITAAFVFSLISIYQIIYINHLFNLDYQKYEDAKNVMAKIDNDLHNGNFDISKPIVFKGAHTVPYEIISEGYVDFSSPKFRLICMLTDPIDPYLKEKYYDLGKYRFFETPHISTLQWGVTAFDGTSGQLIKFWNLMGIDDYTCETDLTNIEEAETYIQTTDMNHYPNDGYIHESDKYLIVNLGN